MRVTIKAASASYSYSTPDFIDLEDQFIAPFVQTPASLSPNSGTVNTVFTVNLGAIGGSNPIDISSTLTLNGIDVSDEVMNGQYVSTSIGTLVLTVTASNDHGTASSSDTSSITSVVSDWLMSSGSWVDLQPWNDSSVWNEV